MSRESALAHISGLIKAKRREDQISLRAAALQAGISSSTLSRLERGASSLPDSDTLAKLAAWLSVSVGYLLLEQEQDFEENAPKQTTPEIVEVHLRADKNLSPKTAEALATMFRLLYDQMSQIPEDRSK